MEAKQAAIDALWALAEQSEAGEARRKRSRAVSGSVARYAAENQG
jgi:hypothetical protein